MKFFIEIHTFLFKKIHLKIPSEKMASILSRPQCVKWCLDTLTFYGFHTNIYALKTSAQVVLHSTCNAKLWQSFKIYWC